MVATGALASACAAFLCALPAVAQASPPPLQPLVDAAPAGGVLVPPPGRYAGPVVLSRPITLDGEGRVTLDGQGVGTVLTLAAPGTVVRRLHVTGSGGSHDNLDAAISVEAHGCRVEQNVLDDVLFGVHLKGADETLVCGNTITSKVDEPGMRGDAVRVWNGKRNRVVGNDIARARDVTFANGSDNVLLHNRIRDGRYGTQLVFAPKSRLEENFLDGNLTGVAVLYSDDVVLRGNQIQRSLGVAGAGMIFKESSQAVVEDNAVIRCSTGAKMNAPTQPLAAIYFRRNLFAHNVEGMNFYGENGGHVIHQNRFEHNLVQISVSAPMSARNHDWRSNAFDDYRGFDRDHDGVGDTPYELYAFADRIWMEEPRSTFFRNTPVLELLDFLERLAPFAPPELVLRDERPSLASARPLPAIGGIPFHPSCPRGAP